MWDPLFIGLHLNTTSTYLNFGCWPSFGMLKSYSSSKLNSLEILPGDIREQAMWAGKEKKGLSFCFFPLYVPHAVTVLLYYLWKYYGNPQIQQLYLWVHIIFSQLVNPVVRLNCAGKVQKHRKMALLPTE